ncbi:MAG: sulfite exporter TauE/SafE family protein, partial [Rhodobacter sp.]|nr:sulfite exporter TauE/SafE family protein [Rhodobacter sp.]
WPRAETRAVLQPYNAAILALTAVYLGLRGAYDWRVLQATGIALVISITAAQLGLFVFRRMNDVQFRWLLIVLMFCSGIGLLLRELL